VPTLKQGRERIQQLRVKNNVAGSCSTDPSPMMKTKSDLTSTWSIKQEGWLLPRSHITSL